MKGTSHREGEVPRPRIVMERLVRLEEADRSFDLEYWDRVGPEGRLEAMGRLLTDSLALQGREAIAPRLQRALETVQRGRG